MVTRREFNQLLLAAGLAAACVPDVHAASPAAVRNVPGDDTGALDEHTGLILMASAQAVTGVQPLLGHYESYYQHQALYRAGYLSLYREYAEMAAARAGQMSFHTLDIPARVAIIDKIRASSHAGPLFEIPIFQETLAVFERTDAWIQLGYASWPGSPRGLDAYTRPF